MMSDSSAPALPSQRNVTVDAIRGVALLGILVLNVQTFAMPFEAYTNPTAFGNLEGSNYTVWFLTALLGDLKFMTMFSMLFGAGVILLTERLEATGRSAIGVHYRRMAWLLLFGLVHAYGIWYGDILVSYALCGLWVIWLRKLPPGWLLAIGLCLVSVSSLLMTSFGLLLLGVPPEEAAELMADSPSPAESMAHQFQAYTGSWWDQLTHRAPAAMYVQTLVFLVYSLWRASGLMLIGMALYRWGVLSGRCATRVYAVLLGLGILVGIPLVWWGIEARWDAEWDWIKSEFLLSQFNYWGSIPIALGWIALTVLFVRSGMLRWFQHALACVGRMALSNYLLQSLVCTFIFYGHGLGYFGQFERIDQALLVLAMSVAQLAWSPLWLSWFRFGPFEWLWRSLTYWSIQPMTRRPPVIPGN